MTQLLFLSFVWEIALILVITRPAPETILFGCAMVLLIKRKSREKQSIRFVGEYFFQRR